MCSSPFGSKKLFSLAYRERCLTNLKKYRIPQIGKFSDKETPSVPNAAVLVPMCRVYDVPSLLYTVRSIKLRSDSGMISFPGGKCDKNETPVETALRETREEIGLAPNKVDIWGSGPPLPGRNNAVMVTPVLGQLMDLKYEDLHLNKNEVSEVFAVPIEILCNNQCQFYTQFKNGFILPVFMVDGFKIWGLTAIITHVFLSCLLPKDVYNNNWISKKQIIDDTP